MQNMINRVINKIYSMFLYYEKKVILNNIKIQNQGTITIDKSFQFGKGLNVVVENEACLFSVAENVSVRNFCSIVLNGTGRLTLSEGVFFNNFCSINCLGQINIGAHTLLGEGVKIYDHNHRFKDQGVLIKDQGYTVGKVEIGENCWIGSNVTILKDVTIGKNSVIGANCLIIKDVPADSVIYADISKQITRAIV
jgi:acetyltransferase-like isoleucine patch superfamily enzyme